MLTMTRRTVSPGSRTSLTAGGILLCWLAAAIPVGLLQRLLEPLSKAGGAAATIGMIVVAACVYMRLMAGEASVEHGLGVGAIWLVLTILAELIITLNLGDGWYVLLGSPQRPLLRNVLLFAWVFAPVLFARREEAPAGD